jgi:hypothetical protein
MACAMVGVAAQAASAAPVQWAVGDGGNGHWYEVIVVPGGISWPDAQAAAAAQGGYLATLPSEEENLFVFNLMVATPNAWVREAEWAQGAWLGGYQDRTASDYSEPSGGWRWLTGEPWGYTNWLQQPHSQPDNDMWNQYGEDYLCFFGFLVMTPTWNDHRGLAPDPQYYPQLAPSYAVEYDHYPATIDIDPDTLNLKSAGQWITCYIELAGNDEVADIVVSTVRLNGVVAAAQPTQIGDYDSDGSADLMVKFDRSALQLEVGDAVPMTVTGQLIGGGSFEGSDTIRVISPGKGK